MPVRNEAGFIGSSLGAVLAQDYPRDRVEIFIADGMSTDGTREVIERLTRDYPDTDLLVLDNISQVVATGLNRALQQAKGEVIIRVDGHTIIAPDYIRECVAALHRSGAENVGGRMDAVSNTRFGQAAALATSSPFGVGGGRFHYSNSEEFVDTVYMGAWPREVFRLIGLFDEEMVRNQDDELNYRLRAQGGKILLSPRIRSQYYNRTSPRALWHQYFQYGYWKVRVMQKHPRQMRLGQFMPAFFIVILTISTLLLTLSVAGKYLFGLVVGFYLIANLSASIVAFKRNNWQVLSLLPIAFGTLHLAYGSGFLVGLVRFWNYWGRSTSQAKQCTLYATDRRDRTPVDRTDFVDAERQRILREYQRRGCEISSGQYAPWQASVRLELDGRTRAATQMLHDANVFPKEGNSCLEVGFGGVNWLGELIRWGVKASDLHGIDLDQNRVLNSQNILPMADLRVGDAAELPWDNDTFQLVIASTLFTSILDSNVRRLIADEILRVLAPGGALVWYDFAFNNPRNSNVRGIKRAELKELFSGLSGKIRSVTLAPPIARLIAPRSWALATILETTPLLRTHLLAVLTKR